MTDDKPDVENKPELLIVEDVSKPGDEHSFWSGICLIGQRRDSISQLILNPDQGSFDNKFEYDFQDRVLYKSYLNEIKKIDIVNKNQSTIFQLPTNSIGETIDSVAYDWVTKNLYVSHEGDLKVLNVVKTSKLSKKLVAFPKRYFSSIIKVFPNQGFVVVQTDCKYYVLTLINILICIRSYR